MVLPDPKQRNYNPSCLGNASDIVLATFDNKYD